MENPLIRETRKRATRATGALFTIGLLISGCSTSNGSFKNDEVLPECTVDETQAHPAIKLDTPPVSNPNDIEAIQAAIKESPQILIELARRLPSDSIGVSEERSLLYGRSDNAHTRTYGATIGSDDVSNEGDIVCQFTPLGSTDRSTNRQVFYDQDGLNLLAAATKQLTELRATNQELPQ